MNGIIAVRNTAIHNEMLIETDKDKLKDMAIKLHDAVKELLEQ